MIYELSGTVGVLPFDLTLRELLIMAESKLKVSWLQTSAIVSMILNVNRDPKNKPVPLDYFSPYKQKEKIINDTKSAFSAMREVFCKGKNNGARRKSR